MDNIVFAKQAALGLRQCPVPLVEPFWADVVIAADGGCERIWLFYILGRGPGMILKQQTGKN